MKMTGNTILITGGGSGIGLGLAEEFLKRGNEVIVAGRSREKLVAAEKKGLKTLTVDMTSAASIRELALSALKQFPNLNVVIHNAGIMRNENLQKGAYPEIEEETVLTNLLGPMRLTDALLPHFLRQSEAAVITVTSGLAYVPLAMTPTYSATKAAVHSYTQSLRYQLKGTSVAVKELVPPYVRTHLMGERQSRDEFAMPLEDFISEVMQILAEQPEAEEILVKRVLPQRQAADHGREKYEDFFRQMNDRLFAARKEEW